MALDLIPFPPAEKAPSCAWVTTMPEWFRALETRETRGVEPGQTVGELSPWPQADTAAWLNGRPADWDETLSEGDHLSLILVPGVGGVAVIGFVFKLLAGFVIGQLISSLFGRKPAARRKDESSSVYGWGGAQTEYNPAGLPFPVVLGTQRSPGMVLQRFVEVEAGAEPQSFLYLLICVSVGPVKSVAGRTSDVDGVSGKTLGSKVLVNGNNINAYDGVTASMRMGSLNQEVIPGFDRLRFPQEIDLPLATGAAQTFEFDGSVEQIQAIRVRIDHPGGLFMVSGGAALPETVELTVRYRQIDAGGTALSDWLFVYQGFDTTIKITAAMRAAFSTDIPSPLFDIDTFVPPTQGKMIPFDGIVDYGQAQIAGSGYVNGAQVEGFSMVWRGTHQSASVGDDVPLLQFGDWNGSFGGGMVLTGILIRFEGVNASNAKLQVFYGDGTNVVTLEAANWSKNAPFQVSVTYERFGAGGLNVLKIYQGASLRETSNSTVHFLVPNTSHDLIRIASEWLGTVNPQEWGPITYDDLSVWSRTLSADEITALHNLGSWEEVESPITQDGLFGYWIFEEVTTDGQIVDLTAQGNSLMTNTIPDVPGPPVTGFVSNPASGEELLGFWEIEVKRTDAELEGDTVSDIIRLGGITGLVADSLGRPGLALLALKFLATDQLSGATPNALTLVEGRSDCPSLDATTDFDRPVFVRQHSASPAHHAALLLTDRRTGGGTHTELEVDWEAVQAWRQFCSQDAYDQFGTFDIDLLDQRDFADFPQLDQRDFPNGVLFVRFVGESRFRAGFRVWLDETEAGYPDSATFGAFTVHASYFELSGKHVILMAWPVGLSYPGSSSFDGRAWGIEQMIQSHLILSDRGTSLTSALELLCSLGRAAPVRRGDKWSVVYQDSKTPVGVITPAVAQAGTFVFRSGSIEDEFNVATAEISSKVRDYQRVPVTRTHSSLKSAASAKARRVESFDMRGCVLESQARRELDVQLNIANGHPLQVDVSVPLEAVLFLPGDVMTVAWPIPSWGFGDALQQDSATAAMIFVSVEVVLEAGEVYFCAVRSSSDGTVGFQRVASGAGTFAPGKPIALFTTFPFTPIAGDTWAIGTSEFGSRTFQIVNWTRAEDLSVQLELIEHRNADFPDPNDPDVNAEIETSESHGDADDARDDGASPLMSPSAESIVVVEEARHRYTTAQLEMGVHVSWTPTDPSRVARTIVWLIDELDIKEIAAEVTGSKRWARVTTEHLDRGKTYQVVVQHVTTDGNRRALALCSSAQIETFGLFPTPPAPEDIDIFDGGELAMFGIEHPDPNGWEGCSFEILQGGIFIGGQVGSGVIGSTVFGFIGPTPLYSGSPAGEKYYARMVLPNGAPGEPRSEVLAHAPKWLTSEGDKDYEADWVGDGTLTDLEVDFQTRLTWPSANSSLTASYLTDEVSTFQNNKRYHLSVATEGLQLHPATPSEVEASPGYWSAQGPTDPHHPDYDRVEMVIEWRYNNVAGGLNGETFELFVPGFYQLRHAEWRVSFTRPDDSWNVVLSHLNIAYLVLP